MSSLLKNENDTDHEHQSIPRLPAIPKLPRLFKPPKRPLHSQTFIEFTDLSRTFVALGNRQRPILDLFLPEMLVFLKYADCDTSRYHENGLLRDMRRHRYINAQIEAGKLEVIQGLSEQHPRLFLVAAQATLTCTQLAEMDRWNEQLCCPECHIQSTLYPMDITGHRCQGEMCCRGAAIFYDWPRIMGPIPEHSDEW